METFTIPAVVELVHGQHGGDALLSVGEVVWRGKGSVVAKEKEWRGSGAFYIVPSGARCTKSGNGEKWGRQ
jgi:hypothetical protein